jgi:8-oxo-dGTP pyrophosphatase MutT (NUDIX family)
VSGRDGENPWRTLASRVAYENPWIRVREDSVIRPDGKPGIYGVVEVRPSVGIVAVNEEDRIVMVRQWRYTMGRYTWEIPRGGSLPGETDMLGVAARELREEAGVDAHEWAPLGAVEVCNGVTTDIQHLFLARRLTEVAPNHDATEDIVVRWTHIVEASEMAIGGSIEEVCSVAAILRAARALGRSGPHDNG